MASFFSRIKQGLAKTAQQIRERLGEAVAPAASSGAPSAVQVQTPEAVEEALIAAAVQWPKEGRPENPRGWLLRVATRRLTDQTRADTARRLRERLVVSLVPADEQIALAAPGCRD